MQTADPRPERLLGTQVPNGRSETAGAGPDGAPKRLFKRTFRRPKFRCRPLAPSAAPLVARRRAPVRLRRGGPDASEGRIRDCSALQG